MVRVKGVQDGSIAEELGIVPGTELLTVNGRELADFLDWEFLTADDELVIEARLPDGEAIVYEIERPEGESMGVELEPPTIRRCANRCEFCFIEGLPKGLRKPLYVRDDDYRLSFAYGNFATLSNVKERDIARILEYRLSPLYISVHATPWEARKVLLNNPRVPNIVEQLTQARRGRNSVPRPDGDRAGAQRRRRARAVVRRSLDRSATPCMSVAIVPVGLTQFSHLYTGKSMDRDTARTLLARGRPLGRSARATERGALVGVRLRRALSARRASAARRRVLRRLPADRERRRRGRVASRCACSEGLSTLPRLEGRRIGVVTGVSMARAHAGAARSAAARPRARRFELIVDRELAVRSDDDDRRPARRRGHSPRARRSPRSRSRAHSGRVHQRQRRVPRRRAVHHGSRADEHARLSVLRFHRRARARR